MSLFKSMKKTHEGRKEKEDDFKTTGIYEKSRSLKITIMMMMSSSTTVDQEEQIVEKKWGKKKEKSHLE